MKTTYLILLIILSLCFNKELNAQNEFITLWKTDNSTDILIPSDIEYISNYNYDITWSTFGDPNILGSASNQTGNYMISNLPPDTIIEVKITGDFPSIYIDNNNFADNLIEVTQWGDIQWLTFENAFSGCSNLTITAIDQPNFSQVWSLYGMFKDCENFNSDISSWDISHIENMAHMFDGAINFNQNLSTWNVTHVKYMDYMFAGASSFTNMGPVEGEIHTKNNDIGGWDVGQVITMEGMFSGAAQFNGDIGGWDVGQVVNMKGMFQNAAQFNGDIGGWDVGQVVNMADMFDGATNFDKDIGGWDVGQLGMGVTGEGNYISFANSGMSCGNYSLTLQGWSNQSTAATDVLLNASGMEYSPDVVNDRYSLINNKNWTISGDNQDLNCFLSIKEHAVTSFVIYPNPTQDQFTITGLIGYETIQLMDMTGRVLKTIKNHNQTEESIQVNQLGNGVYNLVIVSENGQKVTKKLVKQ